MIMAHGRPVGAKILVTDDDSVNRRLVERVLASEGHTVLEAENGSEALILIEREHLDLVVLDVMMPGMNGYEVCQRVRRNPAIADVLIILLTAHSSIESRLQGFEAGADDFLGKPFEPAELQAHIQALLRRRTPSKEAAQPKRVAGGKTLAFFSLRGGMGVSALATNIAVSLSQIWSMPTALVDLALTCGNSALMLNQTLRHTWADLAEIPTQDCTAELVEQVLMPHESGVRTLAAPPSSELAELVKAPTVQCVLRHLSSLYGHVIIDLPHDFRETTLAALDCADQVVLIFSPDMNSVYAAKRALDTFQLIDYPRDRISLLMNWTFERRGLARASIESALGAPVSYVLPYAESLLIEAINRGIPAVTYHKGKPLAALFEDLAYDLSRDDLRKEPPASPSKSWKNVISRQKSRH
jgi:pilus assembly protein CpaE